MPDLPLLQIGSTGPYVSLLQMNLNGLGFNFNNFAIDGVYGTLTQQAVGSFQDEFNLPRDGIVGPVTWKVLLDNVKAVQRLLNSRGYNAGNPDGWYGQMTTNAVLAFQRDNGLIPEGIVNPRTRRKLFNPHPKDNYDTRPSSNSISALDPYVSSLARKFLDLTKANGMDVRITSAFRSWDESDRLYAQGRTTPGSIISNARGGESYHNWGLAFDAAPFVNGVMSTDIDLFRKMGRLGEQVGLEWGGTFKDLVDYPHFQYTYGLSTIDLLNGVVPS
jgi:Putative peptidoglycan-binding domain-containing protein